MTRSDEHEPYFTVLTDPKFLRARLTDQTRREFFAGGETLVDFIWRTIQLRLAPDFAPSAILEYGCGAGGIAMFQFPYLATTSAVVDGTRWLREHVPGMNGLVNIARGRRPSLPFIPTYTYVLEDVLALFEAAGFPATYLVFDRGTDLS